MNPYCRRLSVINVAYIWVTSVFKKYKYHFAVNFYSISLIIKQEYMKERIKVLLEDVLPLVDLDSDFLFAELDSLGVTTILMVLSSEYGIQLDAVDATPKNLKNLDSIVAMVQKKLESK